MDKHNHHGIIESLLFAAGDEGLSLSQLCTVLNNEEETVKSWINELKDAYLNDPLRGIQLVELAGTYQLATKRDHAAYIKRLVEGPHQATLSQASLETLAIIAYRQPITRIHIEEIRGVKTDRPIHTLAAKGLIKEKGRAEGAGRAILYGTTDEFLDYFGLKDLSELPPLPDEIDDLDGESEETDLFFKSLQTAFQQEEPTE